MAKITPFGARTSVSAAILFAALLVLIVFLALGCTESGAGQAPSNEQDQEEQGQQDQGQREKSQQQALDAAVQDYYKAVDSKDWDHTYDELDSRTKQRFTRDEWVQKNQYFAVNSPLERSSPEVVGDSKSPPVLVRLTQAFKDGTSQSRDTYFVLEGESWKHRFSDEEHNLFMADASFEEFKKAKGQPERAQQPPAPVDQIAQQQGEDVPRSVPNTAVSQQDEELLPVLPPDPVGQIGQLQREQQWAMQNPGGWAQGGMAVPPSGGIKPLP